MIKIKGKIALALCVLMVLGGPLTIFAEDEEPVLISETTAEEDELEFISFEGIVKEITEDNDNLRVLVTKEDENESLILNIGETVLIVGEENQDILSKEDIKLDAKVSAEYHKNTPMGLSYPGFLTPQVLVIKSDESTAYVQYFDNELLSIDDELKLNVSDETSIIDVNGKDLSEEDIYGRDLIVFYNIIMPSLPAKTNPSKIIALTLREESQKMNEIVVESTLTNEFLELEDGTKMIPLREVAEALGFEVTWNSETKSIELLKGVNWSTLTIGKNNYNFAKMIIELESPPIIVESKSYVPASFAEQVLQAEITYEEDGSMKIIK